MANGSGSELGDVQAIGGSEFDQDLSELNDSGEGESHKDPADKSEDEEEREDLDVLSDESEESKDEDESSEEERESEEEGEEEPEKEPKGTTEDDEIKASGRPTFKDLRAKYPDIFKSFPQLRQLLFNEYQFSKDFGSPEEAHQAAVKARNYEVVEASLIAGDPSLIIRELATNNQGALEKVVDNFLPELRKKSTDLYIRAAEPVIRELLHYAFNQGKSNGNKNLMYGAQHIAQLMFNDSEIKAPVPPKSKDEKHPAEVQLEKERNEFAQTRLNEAKAEINDVIDTRLTAVIKRGLDPKGELSEYQVRHIVQDTLDEINKLLAKDQTHRRAMEVIWRKAAQAGFPKEMRQNLADRFLQRALAVAPGVRNRILAEARGEKLPSQGKDKNDKNKQPQQKKRFIPPGRPGQAGPQRALSSKEVDYSRTSDMDIIMDRETRRK